MRPNHLYSKVVCFILPVSGSGKGSKPTHGRKGSQSGGNSSQGQSKVGEREEINERRGVERERRERRKQEGRARKNSYTK